MVRTCRDCGETKKDDLFRPNRNQCLDCRKEFKARWRLQNKTKQREYKNRFNAKAGLPPVGFAAEKRRAQFINRQATKAAIRLFPLLTNDKHCLRCDSTKPKELFYKSEASRDGFDHTCKQCRNDYRKSHELAYRRRPDVQLRRYASRINHRSKAYGVEELVTAADVKAIYSLYRGRCFACGTQSNLTIDHHKPVHLGNRLLPDNATVLCRSCNSIKNASSTSFYSDNQLELLTEIHVKLSHIVSVDRTEKD